MRSGRAGSPEPPARANDQRPCALQMTMTFSARRLAHLGRMEPVLARFTFGT
jgi:hypothetical protein